MEISFWNLLYHRVEIGIYLSLIKVIPLFTLTRKRNNDFHHIQNTALRLIYAI